MAEPAVVDPVLGPEGTDPPNHVPPHVFDSALATFVDGERLDVRALAADAGIGRATLYRNVGGRNDLLGAVVWYLTRRAISRALRASAELSGSARVLAVVHTFMHDVNSQPSLREFLDREPETALQILTSKHGPVQGGLAAALERLLIQERDLGNLKTTIDPASLSYVIVRIGESFLYADVIADTEPDLDLAVELIRRLLQEPA